MSWDKLIAEAWKVRDNARAKTKVGCALLTKDGKIFSGCNVEHKFRSHDIHAETNAISSMVAGGGDEIEKIVIAATRDSFTPCGSCMDWIFQSGGERVQVAFVNRVTVKTYTAHELMPHYPS